MQKLWINGISGRMGQEINALLQRESQQPFELLGGADAAGGWKEFSELRAGIDIVIDFSVPAANRQLLQELQKNSGSISRVLVGTTGLDKELVAAWKQFAGQKKCAVLLAPNTSLGISLMLQSALGVARSCFENNFDIEIAETHHRYKKDAPSGTALFLAKELAGNIPETTVLSNRGAERHKHEIGISVVRGGGVPGEHVIRFLGDEEELTISHRVYSRVVFARGALVLGRWLARQNPGFYSLRDVDFVS
jgi:4-hydroxy-tetrahydrodipicolinate reductase